VTDYGHDLLFGVFVTPAAARHEEVVALVRRADELGLDLVGVQDHPYQPAFLDTWTLLSVLAARTRSIRLFPDVANLPLRPPAVLARSAASLDLLSGGRVELGLGAGAFWDAIAANGGPRRTAGQSVDALAEAIAVIRGVWSSERSVRVEGEHYRVVGARPGPPSAHRVGIWVGAYKRRMLELTGRLADGWVPSAGYMDPPELGGASRILDEAAEAAGRDPAEVRRIYNVSGRLDGGGGLLTGPPEAWAERLTALTLEHGVSAFVLAVALDDEPLMARFAEEVAPRVREEVERERREPAAHPARSTSVAAAGPGAEEELTQVGRRGQQALLQIHDHLRDELAQLREGLGALAEGVAGARTLRSLLRRLELRRACWSVGAFCSSHCWLVGLHHTVEDRRLFPELRSAEDGLGPALDRLVAEHEEIAEVIGEIDRDLAELAGDPPRVDDVRRGVERLAELLLAHLSYEEEQLLGPIGRLAIEV